MYRDDPSARFDELVDVDRTLVVSGGGVGTRRSVRRAFFEERRVSPVPLRNALARLVNDRKNVRGGVVRGHGMARVSRSGGLRPLRPRGGFHPPQTPSDLESERGLRGRSPLGSPLCRESYMPHPLDTPLESPVDMVNPDYVASEVNTEDGITAATLWFECAGGCGRVWDGNSQCQCFL